MNVIYGNISYAKMLAEDNRAITEPLADAEEACEKARELGIRLQAFSLDSAPIKERIMLHAICEEAAETVFMGTNISNSISAADDLLSVEADPRQIRQAIENLLTNAKEAMPDGGTVKVNIENYESDGRQVLSLESDRYVRIAIQDEGCGIPKENLPKIFNPYFSTKETYNQRGMGLGLSICHTILKRHRGYVFVESESGVGTSVDVYLPVSVQETQHPPEE